MLQFFSRFGAPLFCVCLIASAAAAPAIRQQSGTSAAAARDVKALGPQVGARARSLP